jgi:hypothetical protein
MTAIELHPQGLDLTALAGEVRDAARRLLERVTLPLARLLTRQGQPARRFAHSAPIPALVVAGAPVEAARLSGSDQWSRLCAVISNAAEGAKAAAELQSTATRKLDLAQYGLSTLMDELSAVMAVPGRRERARVYVFEPNSPARGQALAA